MTPLEERLIRRLVEGSEALSRNRNFELYEDGAMRRARRVARWFGGLLESLREGAVVERVVHGETAVEVVLVDPRHGLRRACRFSPAEYRLLASLAPTGALPPASCAQHRAG